MLDPKSKLDITKALFNFQWPSRQNSRNDAEESQDLGELISAHEDSIEEYAKTQKQFNTLCISKVEHRSVSCLIITTNHFDSFQLHEKSTLKSTV